MNKKIIVFLLSICFCFSVFVGSVAYAQETDGNFVLENNTDDISSTTPYLNQYLSTDAMTVSVRCEYDFYAENGYFTIYVPIYFDNYIAAQDYIWSLGTMFPYIGIDDILTGHFGDFEFPIYINYKAFYANGNPYNYDDFFEMAFTFRPDLPQNVSVPADMYTNDAIFDFYFPLIPATFLNSLTSVDGFSHVANFKSSTNLGGSVNLFFRNLYFDFSFIQYNVSIFTFDLAFGFGDEDIYRSLSGSASVKYDTVYGSLTNSVNSYLSVSDQVGFYRFSNNSYLLSKPLLSEITFSTPTVIPSSSCSALYIQDLEHDYDYNFRYEFTGVNIYPLPDTVLYTPSSVSGKYYQACEGFDIVCWIGNAVVYLIFDFPLFKPLTSLFAPIIDLFGLILDFLGIFNVAGIPIFPILISVLVIAFLLKVALK